MNAVVPYVPSGPIAPALVPTTMTEAIKLAELMASSKLVPQALQKSAADCLMVIQQAVRWQMDPFAVAQECSVIQGKLMYGGKLVAAVVNARGNLEERLSFEYSGDKDTRTIVVSGKIRGETAPRTVTVVLKDAKTNAAVWTKQPDQQLMYHGARVWARRHTPELMLGVWVPEEFDEPAPAKATPAPVSETSPVKPVEATPPPEHDPVTGEVGPREIALPEADTEWRRYLAWGGTFVQAVNFAKTLAEIDAWEEANTATLDKLTHGKDFPKILMRIHANVTAAREKLMKAEEAKGGGIPPQFDRRKLAPTPADPEAFLAHITETLGHCTTQAELTSVWNGQFLPKLGDMFPPDAAVAMETFEELLNKIAETELMS